MRMPAGMRLPGGMRSGGLGGRRGGIVGGGLGAVVLVLIALFFGVDPGILLDQDPGYEQGGYEQGGNGYGQVAPPPRSASQEQLADFVSVVLADTEDTWGALFQDMGQTYREPTLVLFSGTVQSTCGFAQAAMGPFYCPADQKLYIDLDFYRDLRERFGAPGDFAQAYVIAHEVGHHVQTLLGISSEVQAARRQMPTEAGNALSVRQELQADCFAGVWAYHAHAQRGVLEPGDIDEALNAAAAVGDDRIQGQTRGTVAPDSFTHGSSAQRASWFQRGFEAGEPAACDTFAEGAVTD
jgi:uncharacterized protein